MFGFYVIPELCLTGEIFMLIDWLTLRYPLTDKLGQFLHEKIQAAMGRLVRVTPAGEVMWESRVVDWDAIRSDSVGIYWSVSGDGDKYYLTIGASPSSLLNHGVNVFGSLSVQEGAEVLIKRASEALGHILPNWREWDCRRMDITANYDMGGNSQVKQALRLLLGTDAPRRRTNSDKRGGDSVYWNPTSALRCGKAYHKGAHLRFQQRRGNIQVSESLLQQADSLLRLELKLGSAWFRRCRDDWREFTQNFLAAEHFNFFSSLIGGGDVEVSDMGTLLEELEKHAPTKGQALASHCTWALIKTVGYTQTKDSMPRSTFARHCKYLRAAGLSSADLCAGLVIPFRRKSLVLGNPVLSWDDLQRAA